MTSSYIYTVYISVQLKQPEMTENVSCIPVPPPDSEDCNNRIQKLVGYVCRNGADFENMVREKEIDNPKFDFLRDGDGADYYKWALLCGKMHYSKETVQHIESEHRERLISTTPGFLALTTDDRLTLSGLLKNNTGSKDSIKNTRKWILERAHSMSDIAFTFQEFLNGISTSGDAFTKMLYAVYIINDIFFNPSLATTKGPYTKIMGDSWNCAVDVLGCFSPFLPSILHCVYNHSPDDSSREKLKKILELWMSKHFLTSDAGNSLMMSMCEPTAPVPCCPPVLLSPYAFNLPPPCLPPVPPPPPQGPPQILQQGMPPSTRSFFHNTTIPPGSGPPGAPPGYGLLPMQGLPAPGTAPYGFQPPPALQLHAMPPIDLHNCSVGVMANIVRNSIKLGHAKYTPLNATTITPCAAPFVEPGRLEARVGEFYRKVSNKDSSGHRLGDSDGRNDETDMGGGIRERDRRRSRSRSRDRMRDPIGRGGARDSYGRDRSEGWADEADVSSVGYGGVSGGSGGRRCDNSFSENSERIRSGGNGRGVGLHQGGDISRSKDMPTASSGEPDFASYRTMQSSDYHTRMSEREYARRN